MAVVGVPPVGCVPSQRTIEGGIERHCVPLYNQAAVMFNSKLSTELERLNKTLTGAQVVYIDIYTPLLDLIMRPFAYGNLISESFSISSTKMSIKHQFLQHCALLF